MFDLFEKRLADLIADGLSTETGVQLVTRPRSNLSTVAPSNVKVIIIVTLFDAHSDDRMGDDSFEKRGIRGDYKLKTVLRMSGTVVLECRISPTGGSSLEKRRVTLLRVIDSLMVFLHSTDVRNGKKFDLPIDQGFKIQGFRLQSVTPVVGAESDFSRMELRYHFSGQFWPVKPEVDGDVITSIPSRLAILPLAIPEQITMKAGASVQAIKFTCDTRNLGGASIAIVARLPGASPAGTLSGDTAGLTGGWTAFPVNSSGECTINYIPPAVTTVVVSDRLVIAIRKENGPGSVLAESEIINVP
jgi:hypothetical protein